MKKIFLFLVILNLSQNNISGTNKIGGTNMKKILMVFTILLSLWIIPNFKVEALEDSFYAAEYIDGVYIKKFRGSAGKYEQMRFFRRKSDNQAVYCLETWENLKENTNLTGYDTDQYSYANIDYSTWERIMLIAYYGYGYGNHTDSKWFAITQFMIWKETSPDSILYFTDTKNGNQISKFEDEMNEINELIINHGTVSSFNNNSYELRYKKNYTIIDTNHVLENFDITSSVGLEVNKQGNSITVKATYPGLSVLYFAKTGKRFSSMPIVYVDPTGQDILSPGNFYPIYMNIYLNLPSSQITVNKYDQDTQSSIPQGDAKLIGSKFQLLDEENQVVAEKTVEKNGKVIFDNIGYGDYKLKEIGSGEGYHLNQDIIALQVDQELEEVNYYNQVITNHIIFNKYMKNPITGNTVLEANATFSIYNSKNEKIVTFTTDKNGQYQIDLPYGTYTVKQESGMKNHFKVKDFKIMITEQNKTQKFNLYNEELVANIKIINTDQDSNLPLLEKGATFKIKNLDTEEYIKDQNGNIIILETNDLGNTIFLLLSSGNYQIEQINAIDGYIINTNSFPFEITDQVDFKIDKDGNRYLEVIVPNQKQKSRIIIEKIIESYLNDELVSSKKDNSILIPIYAQEDVYSKDGIKLYSKEELVDIAQYNNGRIITKSLYLGNYYMINPIDDTIINIFLDSTEEKKVDLLEKIYEYTEEENEVIVVPNTYTQEWKTSHVGYLFIVLGLLLIKRKRNYEKSK